MKKLWKIYLIEIIFFIIVYIFTFISLCIQDNGITLKEKSVDVYQYDPVLAW